MSIDCKQLKNLVIIPALTALNLCSDNAVKLMLGTCAQETLLGTYLAQVNGGSNGGLGIYQMQKETFEDICDNVIDHNPTYHEAILNLGYEQIKFESIAYDLQLATMLARLVYARQSERLPIDLPGMAAYYKKYYNTPLGAATEQEFIDNYNRYVIC